MIPRVMADVYCICDHGEPCYHEAFVFAVGQTAGGSVELDILQTNGRLSRLTISNFSSWRKSTDAFRLKSSKKVRRFHKPVLIDRIVRHAHCLTVDCGWYGIAYLFFGSAVTMAVEDVCQVAPPNHFGEGAAEAYRQRYLHYFQRPTVTRHKREGGADRNRV